MRHRAGLMRVLPKLILALAGLAVFTGYASAQTLFEDVAKDFGTVPRGTDLTHSFKLTNTLGSPLHVMQLRSSCGCAIPAIGKSDLEPGESTFVNVNVNTLKFSGAKTFTIFVLLDRPYSYETRLSVSANSREDFTINPSQLAFGRIKKGSGPTASLTVERYGPPGWQITGIENENAFLIPELVETARDANHAAYQLKVKLREDTPAGGWVANVILLTNDASVPRIQVPLTVEIEGTLTATPTEATFGRIKPGTQPERKVVIRGSKPFKITKIEGTDDECQVVNPSSESKPVHVLTAKLNVGANPGEISHRIKVHTDLEDESIEFTVQAQVRP